jgi:iron complex transport system ATP-binding protein
MKCYELSDGQFQKVMIGRALAQDTPIILLDEPTTHLDLHHKVQILTLLRHIAHSAKKTVLFTSHEIDLAIQLCDKILIMGKDEMAFGTPNELIEKGCFHNLFPEDLIKFDEGSQSFKISN